MVLNSIALDLGFNSVIASEFTVCSKLQFGIKLRSSLEDSLKLCHYPISSRQVHCIMMGQKAMSKTEPNLYHYLKISKNDIFELVISD